MTIQQTENAARGGVVGGAEGGLNTFGFHFLGAGVFPTHLGLVLTAGSPHSSSGTGREDERDLVKPAARNFWTKQLSVCSLTLCMLDICHAVFSPLHGGNLGHNKAL